VDAQLPPDLARYLREQGHEARAVREQTVVVTKDEDFAQRVLASRKAAPVVVWLRVGNCSNRALRTWFAPLLPKIVEAVQQGERLVEVV
jgi:predicted nuclease of predicted toxin-antitoxin system